MLQSTIQNAAATRPFQFSPHRGGIGIAIVGAALIAVTHGLVRFSYGQFLPQIRAELSIGAGLAGLISGGVFIGACLALIASARLTHRFGPRAMVMAAGLIAAIGFLAVSLATGPLGLACALTVTGLGTGLALLPLCLTVSTSVVVHRRSRCVSTINAGACLGTVMSGPVALLMLGVWRDVYLAFAVLALFVTFAAFVTVPQIRPIPPKASATGIAHLFSAPMRPLLVCAFLIGMVSSVFWAFGGEVLSDLHGWQPRQISAFWVVLGLSGLFGAFAGSLCRAYGMTSVHRIAFAGLCLGTGLFAVSDLGPVPTLAAAIAFGMSCVTLTGVNLIWSMRVLPQNQSGAIAAALFMIPAGQFAGAGLFGQIAEMGSTFSALMVFTLLAALGTCFSAGGKRIASAATRQSLAV